MKREPAPPRMRPWARRRSGRPLPPALPTRLRRAGRRLPPFGGRTGPGRRRLVGRHGPRGRGGVGFVRAGQARDPGPQHVVDVHQQQVGTEGGGQLAVGHAVHQRRRHGHRLGRQHAALAGRDGVPEGASPQGQQPGGRHLQEPGRVRRGREGHLVAAHGQGPPSTMRPDRSGGFTPGLARGCCPARPGRGPAPPTPRGRARRAPRGPGRGRAPRCGRPVRPDW